MYNKSATKANPNQGVEETGQDDALHYNPNQPVDIKSDPNANTACERFIEVIPFP